MIDPQTALIYTMVLVSASDSNMTDKELETIGDLVQHLPIFRDYEKDALIQAAQGCAERLAAGESLDEFLNLIADNIAPRLYETAYALACEVAAADGKASQEELRFLELLRHRLNVGRLEAAAIERGTRARYMVL